LEVTSKLVFKDLAIAAFDEPAFDTKFRRNFVVAMSSAAKRHMEDVIITDIDETPNNPNSVSVRSIVLIPWTSPIPSSGSAGADHPPLVDLLTSDPAAIFQGSDLMHFGAIRTSSWRYAFSSQQSITQVVVEAPPPPPPSPPHPPPPPLSPPPSPPQPTEAPTAAPHAHLHIDDVHPHFDSHEDIPRAPTDPAVAPAVTADGAFVLSVIVLLLVQIGGVSAACITYKRYRKEKLEKFLLTVVKTVYNHPKHRSPMLVRAVHSYLHSLTPHKPVQSLREKHTPTPNQWPLGWQRRAVPVDPARPAADGLESHATSPPSLHIEAKRLQPLFDADNDDEEHSPFRAQDNPLWRPIGTPSVIAHSSAPDEVDHTDGVHLEMDDGLHVGPVEGAAAEHSAPTTPERLSLAPTPARLTPAVTEMPTPILDTPQREQLIETGLNRLFDTTAAYALEGSTATPRTTQRLHAARVEEEKQKTAQATVMALEKVFKAMDVADAQTHGGVMYSPPPAPRGVDRKAIGFKANERMEKQEAQSDAEPVADAAQEAQSDAKPVEDAEQEVQSNEQSVEREVKSDDEPVGCAEQEVWSPPATPGRGAWNGGFRAGSEEIEAHSAVQAAQLQSIPLMEGTRLSASSTESDSAAGSLVYDDGATSLPPAAELPCSTPELAPRIPSAAPLIAETLLSAAAEEPPPADSAHVESRETPLASSSSGSDGFLELDFDVSNDAIRYMFPGRSPPATPLHGNSPPPAEPLTPITALEATPHWQIMHTPQTAVTLVAAESPFSTPGDGPHSSGGLPAWAQAGTPGASREESSAVASPMSVVSLEPTDSVLRQTHTEPPHSFFDLTFGASTRDGDGDDAMQRK
jgi:hypothetical protein